MTHRKASDRPVKTPEKALSSANRLGRVRGQLDALDAVAGHRKAHGRDYPAFRMAMVGGRAREIYDAEASARQKSALKKGSKSPVQEKLPERGNGQSRDQVGKAIGVSNPRLDAGPRGGTYWLPKFHHLPA